MNARKRGEGKTPHRTFRAENELWDGFGEAVTQAGYPDRTAVLCEFLAWYQRMPGAKLPKRPEDNRSRE